MYNQQCALVCILIHSLPHTRAVYNPEGVALDVVTGVLYVTNWLQSLTPNYPPPPHTPPHTPPHFDTPFCTPYFSRMYIN